MIRSLGARLTLLEQFTALVAVAAFGLLTLWTTTRVLRAERQAFVTRTAERLAQGFDDEFTEDPDTSAAVQSVLDDAREVGLRAEVRDPAGRVMASSRTPAVPRSGRDARADAGRDEAFVATAASPRGERITVTSSDRSLEAISRTLARSLLLAALPILVLSLVFGRSVVARALRPLPAMAERAASLSLKRNPRSLGARSGLAELDHLAASFDRLLERLDDALKAERRLTADASHELRTPLTVLGGELELLLEGAPPGSAAALGLARAAEQVAAMRELVEALLLLHRTGEIGAAGRDEREVLNLCDLARETVAEVRPRYPGREPDLALAVPDEILVSGHGALLTSALGNLLDNALKFTSQGQRVRLELFVRDDEALLAVDDAGPGIPAGERERVFDPFYRGPEARAGAAGFGLGLPILRLVARGHGGDVQVLDSPLGGARFVLRLPRLAGGETQGSEAT